MSNLVLIVQAAQESEYSAIHIRLLLRKRLVNGQKVGGTWLVDVEDLKRYEQAMKQLGTKKFDPTRGEQDP
jgi:hypothetical protein